MCSHDEAFSVCVISYFLSALFVPALQLYQEGQIPAPDPMVTLCFGEELHDLSTAKTKLIIVQVTEVISPGSLKHVVSPQHSPRMCLSK